MVVCCRLHKKMKATSEVSYPAYGVTGPAGSPTGKDDSPGDRKLAQSAQMYHYQHQKQQMIASERYARLPHQLIAYRTRKLYASINRIMNTKVLDAQ